MADKESKKTLTFLLVAGMAVLVAIEPWRSGPADISAPDMVGEKLFPEFTDPLAAKSLDIVKFNEENASIRDFKVDQVNGVWSIPSHSNYPADAKQHMAEAATALMDLKILNVASDRPGDRKEYGVITPDPKELKVGMTGVGTRVTVKDGKDEVLADLVIGKTVKDNPALHYVRRTDQDQIYTVQVDTKEMSTKFGDWIEKDLLKLNTFDVREVVLNDYSSKVEVSPQGQLYLDKQDRNIIKLDYDDAAGKWNIEELTEFDEQKQPQVTKLAEDQELDTQKLNDLKNALDDLQIVNVERKPEGLSRDLAASEEFLNNPQAMQSLAERGFVPVPVRPGGEREIYSTDGEVTCTTKDGVKYVLRFGNLAGTSMPDEPAAEGEEPKSAKPNRYLFVMAEFDESVIAKPQLKPVPGAAADEAEPAAGEADQKDEAATEQPAAEAEATEKPADEPAEKPADSEPADKPAEGDSQPSPPETKTALLQEEGEAAEQETPAEEKPSAEATEQPADAPAEGEASDAEAKPPEKPKTPEELERLAVERENKRLQEEYDSSIKRGQEKVQELNDRFADWYFIISDEVFQKIRLGLDDIVKEKPAEKPDTLNELDNLEDGIKIGPGAKDAPSP